MIRRYLTTPNSPPPQAAAKWLAQHLAARFESGAMSADGVLIIAATRNAGRNMRAHLANELHKTGVSAIGGLNIETYESLAEKASGGISTLGGAETLALWIDVLQSADPAEYYGLFPNKFPEREDFANIAREISSLQSALAENLHTIESAAEALGDSADARWKNLAGLEKEFFTRAKKLGKMTREQALKTAAHSPALPAYSEIIIAGNPETSGAMEAMLKSIEKNFGTKISALAFGDDESLFDEFGRPVPEKYNLKDLKVDDADIIVCADVNDEACAIAKLAAQYAPNTAKILSVSCDQENNTGLFESRFKTAGAKAAPLEPKSLRETSVRHLLASLAEYIKNPSFAKLSGFIKNPYAAAFAENFTGKPFAEILADIDFVFGQSVPSDAAQAVGAIRSRAAAKDSKFSEKEYLSALFDKIESLAKSLSADGAAALLSRALKDLAKPAEGREKEALNAFDAAMLSVAEAQKNTGVTFRAEEIFDFAISSIDGKKQSEPIDEDAVPLRNWIEIFWSDTPHVVAADMNDGIVPMANGDGPFLSDGMREKLGLRCQKNRQARDAYMLETLCASRQSEGMACTICVPRRNLNSDPLSPSRILFQTPNLPARVKTLFAIPKEHSAKPHAHFPWKLKVPAREAPARLSPSKINTYLDSPWEFYLKYVLKAEIFDAQKSELDAAQMGELFHSVFDAFARADIKNSDNESEIKDWLLKKFRAIARERFGAEPRAQIRLQLFSLAQRISAAAKAQAAHRAEGWRIIHSERDFSFIAEGVEIAGRFDRIDENENTGELLIIDYKTFDKAPEDCTKKKHLREKTDRKSGEVAEREWLNLQMPIYLRAAREIWKGKKIHCAYFVAPKDVSETKIDFWKDIGETFDEAVLKTSEIVAKIKSGDFSLESKPQYDNYDEVFRIDFDTLKAIAVFEK